MKILTFFILILALTTISCSNKTICTDPKNSDCYLCEISTKYNTTPENVAKFIESINLINIYKHKYEAKDALKILKDIKEKLNTNISYFAVKEIYSNLIKKHPALFILSVNYSSYINEFSSHELIDSRSKELLQSWVDKIIMDMELIVSMQE